MTAKVHSIESVILMRHRTIYTPGPVKLAQLQRTERTEPLLLLRERIDVKQCQPFVWARTLFVAKAMAFCF